MKWKSMHRSAIVAFAFFAYISGESGLASAEQRRSQLDRQPTHTTNVAYPLPSQQEIVERFEHVVPNVSETLRIDGIRRAMEEIHKSLRSPALRQKGVAAAQGSGAFCQVEDNTGQSTVVVPASIQPSDSIHWLHYSDAGLGSTEVNFLVFPLFEGSPLTVVMDGFNAMATGGELSNDIRVPFGIPSWDGNLTAGWWALVVLSDHGAFSACFFLVVDPCAVDGLYGDGTCDPQCPVCDTDCGCCSDPDCDDGLFCNGSEMCNEETGECVGDAEPCGTVEVCSETDNACDCSLDDWNYNALNSWATDSFDHGVFETGDGACTVYIRGGINNGAGGTQVLYRPDWSGNDARVEARVKAVGLDHGIYIGGGVLGRYTPLDGGPNDCPPLPGGGMGYAAYLHFSEDGADSVNLIRRDGTLPGPNYCYTTAIEHLASQEMTFEADTWYSLAIEPIGDIIRVYVDGELALEAQDDTYGGGAFGVYYHGSRPGLDSDPPEMWYSDITFQP